MIQIHNRVPMNHEMEIYWMCQYNYALCVLEIYEI